MRIHASLIAVALLLLVVLSVPAAQAQSLWGMLLYDPVQCGPPGSTLTYHGELTNYAQRELDGVLAVAFDTQYVTDFGFDPALLSVLGAGTLPAAGYSGSLFYLTWAPGAPAGFQYTEWFSGWFGVPGGAGESHSAAYTAGVCGAPPVPEPSALVLLGASVVGLLVWRRRRV